jgi:UDP-glucose 4-epimerase
MTILITGGSGFIGSHLVEHYQGRATVRVLDNFHSGHRRNLEGLEVDLIEGSILDRPTLDRAMAGVDIVFHLAAMISVPESVHDPLGCLDLNGRGLLQTMEAAAQAGVKKFVFASSAAIYGDDPTVPKVESMIPQPKSPYAITKLDGEHYCRFYQEEGRLQTACVRFFNVFGPRQDPSSGYAAAVPIFMKKAVLGDPMTIHGDGGQTRDFIYVKDIAGALAFVAETPEAQGVYNAGYGGSVTVKELAERIIAQAGSASEIHFGPVRAGDVRHSRASADRLREAGWVPRYTLEQGLAHTLESFQIKS